MRILQLSLLGLFALAVGFALAHFTVLFFNQWYFASFFWLKVGLLTPLLGAVYGLALVSSWRWPWFCLGFYWLFLTLGWCIYLWVPGLYDLTFAGGLNFETAFLWPVAATLAVYAGWRGRHDHDSRNRLEQDLTRELKLRYRLKRLGAGAMYEGRPESDEAGDWETPGSPSDQQAVETSHGEGDVLQQPASLTTIVGMLLLCGCLAVGAWLSSPAAVAADSPADDTQVASDDPAAFSQEQQYPEPAPFVPNRHEELTNPSSPNTWPQDPGLPAGYPVPMHLRANVKSWLVIENWRDGVIAGVREQDEVLVPLGHVLAPVAQVNPQGFTASGWAQPGTVCATAVNAIHLKTDHDYAKGRGVIFSLLPVEFADFTPRNYASYFNESSSLFTDIPAGTSMFGGEWAPLVGSRIMLGAKGDPQPWLSASPVAAGWVPQDGDVIVIEVIKRKYNPEWIEFENRFGGIIWIKELGLDPYPLGQVLKPVAGVGRFQGSTYADVGRIRANHPGVLCISTSRTGLIGGFQIIPRDHAMSSEMDNARLRTQWMVVGPLWALDQSWEGTPPLFDAYFYPAYNPVLNDDYTVNQTVGGAAAFLGRFTVRGRYSDADDPNEYILLREATYYDDDALVTLTHLRIYFPRT